MPRKYKTPEEWMNTMQYGEEKFVRVGPGRQGMMTLRKGKVPQYPKGTLAEPTPEIPIEKRAKIIKGKKMPSIGASRG